MWWYIRVGSGPKGLKAVKATLQSPQGVTKTVVLSSWAPSFLGTEVEGVAG